MVGQILSFKEMTLVARYLVVLMSGKQLLRLLVTQLLTQGGQQVAQLGGADETVPILRLIFLIFCKSRLFSKFMSVSEVFQGSRIISPRPIDPQTLGPRTLDLSHPKSQGPVIRGPMVLRTISPGILGPWKPWPLGPKVL